MARDPITAYWEALKQSERLRGVQVLLGPKELARAGVAAQPRVVIVPVVGPLVPPENKEQDLAEEAIELDCICWAKEYGRLWTLKASVIRATWDYRLATNVDARHGRSVDYDGARDSTQDGVEVTVPVVVRAGISKEPLSWEAGIGQVDEVAYQRST
jgi:hypothetical protein